MADRPSDLKACPFCGSGRIRVAPVRDGLRVSCGVCGAAGPPMYYGREGQEVTALAAVATWNLPAREIDAAPADPVVSAECWRRAVLEGCAIKSFLPSAEWFEQRAIELAKEQSRGR